MHRSFDTRVRVLDMRIGSGVSTEPALVDWFWSCGAAVAKQPVFCCTI
jgi:hypothetical protein